MGDLLHLWVGCLRRAFPASAEDWRPDDCQDHPLPHSPRKIAPGYEPPGEGSLSFDFHGMLTRQVEKGEGVLSIIVLSKLHLGLRATSCVDSKGPLAKPNKDLTIPV